MTMAALVAESRNAAPRSSGRKGSKKVRTGCITCKIRKVKCDERKPYCLRCTKTGRRCDGYLDAARMATRRRNRDAFGSSPLSTLSALAELSSQDEKRAFHFFQHVTAPNLSGEFDGVFWNVVVLQLCQAEPAVRHAVLAVSSLHEGLLNSTATDQDTASQQSFALQQYNRAIAQLLGQMSNADVRPIIPLLTCILFVCIEVMQSKEKESLLHLEQGRQILGQLAQKAAAASDTETGLIKRHLVPMYTMLGVTSFLFGGQPAPIPPCLKLFNSIPASFESIFDLRSSMYDFQDMSFRFAKKCREIKYGGGASPQVLHGMHVEQDRLLGGLAKYNVAFSLFRANKRRRISESMLVVIQIYLLTSRIWISMALSDSELDYDGHLETFSAILPLAATYLDCEDSAVLRETSYVDRARDAGRPLRAMFTFETHVIPSLYYTAIKCRHPLVRRSALALLKRDPLKRENLWHANVMGPIAEWIVQLEEEAMHSCLPSTSQASVSFSGATMQTPPVYLSPDGISTVGFASYDIPEIFKTIPPTSQEEDVQHILESLEKSMPATHALFTDPLHDNSFLGADDLDLDGPLNHMLLGNSEVASSHGLSDPASMGSSLEEEPLLDPMLFDASAASFAADLTPAELSILCEGSSSHPSPSPADPYEPRHQLGSSLDLPRTPEWSASSQPSSCGENATVSQKRPQSMDAPWDIKENVRVRDIMIGPEKPEGSWVMIFRKLYGLEAECNARTDFIRSWV